MVDSVRTALAAIEPGSEVELHHFTSELVLRSEIAELFNRPMPTLTLRAYRLYRDTQSEVDQQIRSARTCDAILIRGESGAHRGQTATASQNERVSCFASSCASSSTRRPGSPDVGAARQSASVAAAALTDPLICATTAGFGGVAGAVHRGLAVLVQVRRCLNGLRAGRRLGQGSLGSPPSRRSMQRHFPSLMAVVKRAANEGPAAGRWESEGGGWRAGGVIAVCRALAKLPNALRALLLLFGWQIPQGLRLIRRSGAG